MRALRIVILVIGGVVGLLVLAAVAVLVWVDPNDYKVEIEQRAQQATGRPLHIGGKLDLKLFPWIALQVSDVSLGNPPGYGSEPFLEVGHADVGVKLLPLLRKEIQVRRVTLRGMALNLVSRSAEDNNWKDLGSQEKSAPTPSEPAPRTSVAGLDVEDATLVYRDEAEKSVKRLTHLNVRTGALGSESAVPLKMDFDYDDGSTPASVMHFEAKAAVNLPTGASMVELQELELKGRAGKEGTAFTVSAPTLSLDWKAERLAPATLTVRYGELPLKVTASGEKVFSDRIVTGRIDVTRVSPRDLMKSMGMDAPKARDPRALTAFAAGGDYRLTQNALTMSNLIVDFDDSHIRGTLGVTDLDRKALAFDLGIDAIDIDRYREPEVARGAGESAPPVDLPREAVRELEAKGLLRIARLKVSDLELADVRLPVDASGGQVRLTPQARMFGGRYDGDVRLDARGDKLRMALNDHIRDVDLGALAKAKFDSKRLVGRGDVNFALSGAGDTDTQLLRSLAGKFDLNVRDGAIDGVDLWYELRRATALVKRTEPPTRTQPVRTPFKTLTGSATLANGVVRNEDLRMDMDYLKATGKGTLGVQSQVIDYRLVAQVYKLPAEGQASEMADVKAMDIPIAVTGTLADMKIRPDVGDLVKARVKKEVDKQKEGLKKKLDEKLKSLFNR